MTTSRVILPVLDLEQDRKPLVKKVLKGAKQFQIQHITPQSSSSSSTSWVWQPPSQNTVIDRRIDLEWQIPLNNTTNNFLVGNDATGNILYNSHLQTNQRAAGAYTQVANAGAINRYSASNLDATCSNNISTRQFPLANCMNSIDLTINGTHFSTSLSEYLQAVMTYTTPEYRQRVFNQTGHCPDRLAYGPGVRTPFNPLSLTKFVEGESSRMITLIGAGSQDLYCEVREPLFLSPLLQYFGHGMSNINELSVTINWKSNPLSYLWSLLLDGNDSNSCGVAPTATSLQVAQLSSDMNVSVKKNIVVRYYTPQDDITIPAQISLPYTQPYRFSKDFGPFTSSLLMPFVAMPSVSVVGDNLRLNQIPSCVYLFVKTANSTKNDSNAVQLADVYGPIQNINVQWGNQTGILSGANASDLYEISLENGYNGVRSKHSTDGVVLKLEFGKDIPLSDEETPGMRGDFNWQCNITTLLPDVIRTAYTATFSFEQVFIYEGQLKLSPNECIAMTGIMNLDESVGAMDLGHEVDDKADSHGGSMIGGSSVGGSLWAKVKKGKNILHKVANTTSNLDHGIDAVVKAYKSRA